MQRIVTSLRQAQQQPLAILDLRPAALRIIEEITHRTGVRDRVARMNGRHPLSVAPSSIGVAPELDGCSADRSSVSMESYGLEAVTIRL